jgi:hypothetical protein
MKKFSQYSKKSMSDHPYKKKSNWMINKKGDGKLHKASRAAGKVGRGLLWTAAQAAKWTPPGFTP